MNKDLPDLEVKNVTIVIKPEGEGEHWTVHLVNTNKFPIKDVLVASQGYGEKSPNREETSIIRQFFDELGPNSSTQVELIDPAVFHLFNEYGVTYYIDREIYFKKFVFVPDSIIPENLVYDPTLMAEVIIHS